MSRRGNGEGSVFQRKDGRWVGTVTLGYESGRRRRKSIYGKTQREVVEKLAQIRRDVQLGMQPADERTRVGELLQRWLDESARPRVRPRTLEGYRAIVRLHLDPTLGHVPLVKLTPIHVQELLNTKLDDGFSPTRVRAIHAVLRAALNQAERWELIHRNVSRLVTPPGRIHNEIEPLNVDQARALLRATERTPLGALYSVALSVGLRLGEALGLQWDDIDLDERVVAVRRSLQRFDGRLQLVEPKTDRSRRSIHLPEPCLDALRAHRSVQLERRLRASAAWDDRDFVFTTSIGTPLEPRNVLRTLKRDLANAGLPDIRFHDLRHTCASLLVAQNVHPRIVMETLGHTRISTTLDLYSHVSPAMQREAAVQMEALFGC